MVKNELVETSCIRCVGGREICTYCTGDLIKYGYTKAIKQRFKCKNCGRSQVSSYSYVAYHKDINHLIIKLTREGLGIRSTARFLGIATTTLFKRIISIANELPVPQISTNKTYEVDEMRTYIKSKERVVWIVCVYEREGKRIVSFCIGSRTNKTLNVVLKTLKLAQAKRIFTDGLRNYRYLIDKGLHRVKRFATSHIERFNLTLRTHLKRLNRRTICFSRSLLILNAVLKIYLWG